MNYFTKVIKLDSNIAKSKNKALKEGLISNKDYIFLVEDNCIVLDDSIYKKFVDVSQKTGIEVLTWAEGGTNRKLPFDEDPYINYYTDFPTAFVMYTRNAIEKVGLLDENMPPNTWQELEHSKRIGDQDMSTPFGMFASPKNITELKLTSSKNEFTNLKQMEEALKYWENKDMEDFPIDIKEKPTIKAKTLPITEMI
jgi:hypothetical protein